MEDQPQNQGASSQPTLFGAPSKTPVEPSQPVVVAPLSVVRTSSRPSGLANAARAEQPKSTSRALPPLEDFPDLEGQRKKRPSSEEILRQSPPPPMASSKSPVERRPVWPLVLAVATLLVILAALHGRTAVPRVNPSVKPSPVIAVSATPEVTPSVSPSDQVSPFPTTRISASPEGLFLLRIVTDPADVHCRCEMTGQGVRTQTWSGSPIVLAAPRAGVYRLKVAAPGYQAFKAKVEVSGEQTLQVVLKAAR